MLSLWEQIGDNPTCQNYTLSLILQFLLLHYTVSDFYKSQVTSCSMHNPPISILCEQSPLCCNVLYLVHGLFLQLLESSRLHWDFPIASRLYTRPLPLSPACSNAFYTFYTQNMANPHQVILQCFILLFILIVFDVSLNILDFYDKIRMIKFRDMLQVVIFGWIPNEKWEQYICDAHVFFREYGSNFRNSPLQKQVGINHLTKFIW